MRQEQGPVAGLALGAGAVLVLSLADLTVVKGETIAGTLAVAPLLAAAADASPRATAAVGGLAVAASAVLQLVLGSSGPAIGFRLAMVLLAAVGSTVLAVRRERRERRIVNLTRVAAVAQRALLAPLPRVVGPVAVASSYRSASDEASVGGDLLDAVQTNSGTHFIVGDVKGKGLAAVDLAAATLRAFRDAIVVSASPASCLLRIDTRLGFQLGEEDFVTAVVAAIDDDGVLHLANAAHPSPLLMTREGERRLLEPPAPTTPLGLAPEPVDYVVQLRPGDRVLLYTDGLIEARTRSGEFVSLDALTAPALGAGSAAEALERIAATLNDRVQGHFTDDLALLLLEYRGAGGRLEANVNATAAA
ncbi:MAG: serine/threonine-protein phosphatase [Actinomycetota bacterium]|nr:serine/threonine-protein phosphatase [Actinomycetota bacterium]